MKRPQASPERIAPVLDDVLRRLDTEQQLQAYRIWIFWNDEVGEHIARRAQPLRFRNGILFVTVSTHSWMQELQFMKDDLRERLNSRLPTALVRDIYFVSGSVKMSQRETAVDSEDPNLDAATSIALPNIEDARLAAAFDRLATQVAARRGRNQSTNKPSHRRKS